MPSSKNQKLRVLFIFGTRPEAIKVAPVIRQCQNNPNIETLVCVTAQHREMLDQVLNLFDIKPDVDLNLMRPGQSLSQLTAAVFEKLDPVLTDLKPDWVLVQGDTTTVMASALLAYYHRIRIGHIEAGLRTGDKWQPFPEEVNRRVAGVVADLHFAPTEFSRQNLLKENTPASQIAVTGNPVIDALHMVAQKPYDFSDSPLAALPTDKRIILVTAHRRENFGEPIIEICKALLDLAEIYKDDAQIVYPVHLNPNVQEPVNKLLGNHPNITLLPPLDYLPLVQLLKKTTILLTDSGGLQEEAPGLGIPVLVLREVTERPEGVESGTVRLVGTDREKIVSEARKLLDNPAEYEKMSKSVNPYGDGHASERIVDVLLAFPL